MSETKAYVHELKTLMSGLENQIANDEHLISVLLLHFAVDVIATEAELSNLLGEQLHTCMGVAKNDALVDPELRKQCIQARRKTRRIRSTFCS